MNIPAKIRRGSSIGAFLFMFAPGVVAGDSVDGIKYTGTNTQFPEITNWTAAKWATQAAFAPETLKYVIPMYTYKIRDLIDTADWNNVGLPDNPLDPQNYIALLPPRIGDEEKPAVCGTALVFDPGDTIVNLQGKNKLVRDFFESVADSVANNWDIKTQSDCHTDFKDGREWYIATPVPEKIFGDNAPREKAVYLWTKTGAWDINPDSAIKGSIPLSAKIKTNL